MDMPKVKCPDCSKSFTRASSLKRHALKHSRQQSLHQCSECLVSFPRADALSRHRKMHNGEGTVPCKKCSRRYRSDYLIRHLRTCKGGSALGPLNPTGVQAFRSRRRDAAQAVKRLIRSRLQTDGGDQETTTPGDGFREVVEAYRRGNDRLVSTLLKAATTRDRIPASLADYYTALDNSSAHRVNFRNTARTGNILGLEICFIRGDDINALDHDKRSPLCLAAKHFQASAIEWLLEHKASVNGRDNGGSTALLLAIRAASQEFAEHLEHRDFAEPQSQYRSVLQLLLDAGADVNKTDNGGITPLHLAASWGCCWTAKTLIEKGVRHDIEDVGGWSPLRYAVQYREEEIVKMLLEDGANCNAQTRGDTVLTLACMRGSESIVEYLLHAGADPNTAMGDSRRTALNEATLSGRADIVVKLLEAGAWVNLGRPTALMIACSSGEELIIDSLINAGADPNVTEYGPYGRTALKDAISFGNADTVAKLLKAGAQVSLGSPAVLEEGLRHYVKDQKKIVRMLLDAGAEEDLLSPWLKEKLQKCKECKEFEVN